MDIFHFISCHGSLCGLKKLQSVYQWFFIAWTQLFESQFIYLYRLRKTKVFISLFENAFKGSFLVLGSPPDVKQKKEKTRNNIQTTKQ